MLILLFFSLTGRAQMLSTVAGTDYRGYNGDNILATEAGLNIPHAVAVDTLGNLYIADTENHRVRKVNAAGIITTVAGNGTDGYSGDGGPATQAAVGKPVSVAVDRQGNLFVADSRNHCVRKVTPAGTITTAAGTGTAGFSGDNGAASQATLNTPIALAVDRRDNLYIADNANSRIRKVTPDGLITTVAGNGTAGLSGDNGPATQAAISGLTGMVLDDKENLFFINENRIRKIDTTGTITSYTVPELNYLNSPYGIAADRLGNFIVISTRGYIYKVDPAGNVILLGGNDYYGFSGDGASIDISAFRDPLGIALDNRGNIFIADSYNYRIRRMTPVAVSPSAIVNPVCPDQPISLTATTAWGFVPTSYTWRSETYNETTKVSQPGTWTATGATPTFVAPSINDPTLFTLIATGTDGQRSATSYVVFRVSAQLSLTLALNPASSAPGSTTVTQNTPFVSVTVSGCTGGTINWTGSDGSTGTTRDIAVPTSAIGTLVYSATCTQGSCGTATSTAMVHVAPPVAKAALDGYIYGGDCESFRGWAWDYNRVNTALSVEILDGPNVIATLSAGDFRQDLLDNGKGNGYHAFRYTLPDGLKDGFRHILSARVAGSSFILKGSPRAVICQPNPTSGTNQPPTAPTLAPMTARVSQRFSAILPAFTDPEGESLTYALHGLPQTLEFNAPNRTITGSAYQVGTFLLTYSATDPNGANNSVSFALTVYPESTTSVTGNFEGYLDRVECSMLRGWVWNRDQPNTPLTVELLTEKSSGALLEWRSTVANAYRHDLEEAGKGNGAHAFSLPINGLPTDELRVRVLGSNYLLKRSPHFADLSCSYERRSADQPAGLQVRLLGNPVNDQVQVEIRGAEGQPIQLQLTDSQGRLVSQRQIERAGRVEQQTLPVGKAAPGLLFLRTTSGLNQLTLKVLRQ